MKSLKSKIILIIIFAFFQSCKAQDDHVSIAFFEKQIVEIDENVKNSIKEAYVSITSKDLDSITIIKLDTINNISKRYLHTSKLVDNYTREFYNSQFDDAVKVNFKSSNQIVVDNDIYYVENNYYKYLKIKIIEEGSILDFVNLIKDGYGRYSKFYPILIDSKITRNKKEIDFKIKKVRVVRINYQSPDEEKTTWQIDYDGDSAVGDYFQKKIVDENGKYKIWYVDQGNERIEMSKKVYHNKQTKLDSVVGKWKLNSNMIEHSYINCQLNLTVKNLKESPKDIIEIKKLLDVLK